MPTLSIDIEARLAQFQDGLDRVARNAGRSAQQLDRAFSGLRSTLASFAGIAIGGGIVAGINTTIKDLAALNDGATQAGISVESLSSLLNTLAPTGIGLSEIVDLTNKLSKAALQADNATSKQAQAFKALGVETRDAAGNLRSADAILEDVAKSLAQYANDGNKVAIAQALLEESGARYLPILGDLAVKSREAATVTSEQALAADELADDIASLTRAFTILRQELVAGVAPALSDFFKRYLALAKLGSGPVELIENLFGDSPDDRVAGLQRRINDLMRIREEMAKAGEPSFLQRALNPSLRTKDSIDQELIELAGQLERAKQIKGQFDALFAAPPAGPTGSAPAIPGTPDGGNGKGTRPALAKLEQSALTTQQQGLVEAFNLTKKLADESAVYAETLRALDLLYFDNQISVEQYDLAVQKLTGSQAKVGQDGLAALRDQAEAWKDTLDPLREFIRQVEQVDRAVDAGFLSQAQAEAIKARLAEVGEKTNDVAKELGFTFQSAFEDAVLGGEKLRNVLASIGQDVARIFLRQSVTTPLANFFGGLFGGARASGGPVSGGTSYLVGEKGPELFVPKSNGYIVPNGAGGATIVQHITVGSGVSKGEMMTAMTVAKNQTLREINESMRRGGVFA